MEELKVIPGVSEACSLVGSRLVRDTACVVRAGGVTVSIAEVGSTEVGTRSEVGTGVADEMASPSVDVPAVLGPVTPAVSLDWKPAVVCASATLDPVVEGITAAVTELTTSGTERVALGVPSAEVSLAIADVNLSTAFVVACCDGVTTASLVGLLTVLLRPIVTPSLLAEDDACAADVGATERPVVPADDVRKSERSFTRLSEPVVCEDVVALTSAFALTPT